MTNLRYGAGTLEDERILNTSVSDGHGDRRDFPRYEIPNHFGVALRVLPSTDVVTAQIQNLSRDGVGLVADVFIAPRRIRHLPGGQRLGRGRCVRAIATSLTADSPSAP